MSDGKSISLQCFREYKTATLHSNVVHLLPPDRIRNKFGFFHSKRAGMTQIHVTLSLESIN